ncbi:MAG: ABC transporter substrate-binding protein [Sphingomonadales bacterium]|nr:ABC transporter substrate-binding protein [Sphingomonadales bacterium]MDE2568399.1 ABC transporter substrate-binding protein [Sphingomonadales bacterium]
MRPLRVAAKLIACALFLTLPSCSRQESLPVPTGYPSSYSDIIRRAIDGKSLLIWSTVDRATAAGLMAAFHRRYPDIRVTYEKMETAVLYDRFRADAFARKPAPDFLWSSAMDLQIKLVNDGFAQTYLSPERGKLPDWANWKDQAWGTTAEPIIFAYNKKLVAEAHLPQGHIALTHLLESKPSWLDGKIGAYDINRSGAGYLFLSQDEQATHDIWRTVRAMGANHTRTYLHSEAMLDDLAAGKLAIAYDVIGSYALEAKEQNPEIGIVLPKDFTLVMSRIAIIPAKAPHSDAARLFLDFLLSRAGQQYLAKADTPSVRPDVAIPQGLRPVNVPMRAIRVSPALLVDRDQLTRRYTLKRWNEAISPSQAQPGDEAE